MLPTVLTEAAKLYVNSAIRISQGAQHTQKTRGRVNTTTTTGVVIRAGTDDHDVLRNNDLVYTRAVALNFEFHQGVALVMKSFMFGLITDLWGDAPYTNALKGEAGAVDDILPAFDTQDKIYARCDRGP